MFYCRGVDRCRPSWLGQSDAIAEAPSSEPPEVDIPTSTDNKALHPLSTTTYKIGAGAGGSSFFGSPLPFGPLACRGHAARHAMIIHTGQGDLLTR